MILQQTGKSWEGSSIRDTWSNLVSTVRLSLRKLLPHLPLALSLVASVVLCYHLAELSSKSMFPPGALSSYHLEGVGGATQKFTLLLLILQLVSSPTTMNRIDALKSFGVVSLGLLPLAVFLYASKVTESDWLATASSLMTAFSASLAAQLWVGDYTLLTGLLMSYITAGVLMMYVSRGTSKRMLLLLALSILLTSLTDATAAMIVSGFIVSTAILSGQRLDGFKALVFLGAVPVVVQLALILLAPSGAGAMQLAPVVRFDYLADPIFLGVLVITSALGAVAIARKSGIERLIAPAWFAIAPIMAFGMPGSNPQAAIPYVIPSLLTLASSALISARGALTLDKARDKDDQEITEVTVDVPRAMLVTLVAYLLVSSTVSMWSVSSSYYYSNSVSRYFTDKELTSAIDWLKENVPPNCAIIAPPAVAPWLQALVPNRIVGFRTMEERMAAEAVTRTNFRIQTPYLLMDDWEPYSTTMSPLISAYDGSVYVDILFIDDSFVRTTLTKEGQQYVESSYGAAYLGYDLSEHPEGFVLVQSFMTQGLEIEKTIRTYKTNGTVEISYTIKPRAGVSLRQLVLPVRISPGGSPPRISVDGSRASFMVSGLAVQLDFTHPSSSLEVRTWDEGNMMVQATFEPREGLIQAGVTINAEVQGRSSLPSWAGSVAELLRKYNISYVVSQADYDPFARQAGSRGRQALSIIDSFNRIMFQRGESTWIEAPYNALVASESERVEDNVETRFVAYSTAGLLINKTILVAANNFSMFLDVVPKDPSSRTLSANITLWLPWSAILVNHTISGGVAKLYTDAGSMLLSFTGDVKSIEVGRDPEFGQLRVLVSFDLSGPHDRIGVTIHSGSNVRYEYVRDSRPYMKTCDRTVVYLGSDLYTELVCFGVLKLYATSAGHEPA